MKTKIILSGLVIIAIIMTISLASSLTIADVTSGTFSPGEEHSISVKIKNTLSKDVEDVSLALQFTGTGFSSVGSSEDQVDEILEDDTEKFTFRIKASSETKPGDYQIPYIINYKNINGTSQTPKQGSIGLTVEGNPDLEFVLIESNQVLNQKGKLDLKIVNKGFGQAKFVSVKLSPIGFSLLSENNVYIGSINSDDFETASFDVIFNQAIGSFSAIVEYKDFDNNPISKQISLPIKAYTQEEAIQLGIIQKSNALTYVIIIIVLIIAFFVYRGFKKRAKLRRAREANKQGL